METVAVRAKGILGDNTYSAKAACTDPSSKEEKRQGFHEKKQQPL
jgi:hypothetical protein